MDSIRAGTIVLSVSRGPDQQWVVTEQNIPQPLASFSDPRSACEWAIVRAKGGRGRVVVEEMVGNPIYPGEAAAQAKSFKFSIPVTWTDSGHPRPPSSQQQKARRGRLEAV